MLNLFKYINWYAYISYIWCALMLKQIKINKFMSVKELLDVQNGRETIENEDDSRVIKIEDSPFVAVKNDDGWRIVIGNMYASDKVFSYLDDVENYVNSTDWDLVNSLILATLLNLDVINEDIFKKFK